MLPTPRSRNFSRKCVQKNRFRTSFACCGTSGKSRATPCQNSKLLRCLVTPQKSKPQFAQKFGLFGLRNQFFINFTSHWLGHIRRGGALSHQSGCIQRGGALGHLSGRVLRGGAFNHRSGRIRHGVKNRVPQRHCRNRNPCRFKWQKQKPRQIST